MKAERTVPEYGSEESLIETLWGWQRSLEANKNTRKALHSHEAWEVSFRNRESFSEQSSGLIPVFL